MTYSRLQVGAAVLMNFLVSKKILKHGRGLAVINLMLFMTNRCYYVFMLRFTMALEASALIFLPFPFSLVLNHDTSVSSFSEELLSSPAILTRDISPITTFWSCILLLVVCGSFSCSV